MSSILEKIDSPKDLKELSEAELKQLANELRERIIETVSKTGGHLASSLGAVELTVALHRVFDTPRDKIIWDVGHQCYAHKLITGRKDSFCTLRQYQGISGFPKRDESEFDAFDTGHSSTSVSAALGMALARDHQGENYHVVAVIGDGSLTGGMAFEALNYAGDLGRNLIVVVNDNKMSIGSNVGAMAKYLNRLRTDPVYYRGKEEIEQLMKRLPHGSRMLKVAERLKDSVKYLLVPGVMFEELGFTYLGPIDGHDMEAVINVLTSAKGVKGPVMVHLITRKGKGYRPAEEKPDKFHGIGSFDIATGLTPKKPGAPTYTQVFAETLTDLAKDRPNVVAITAAMPGGTGLDLFARHYPDRFYDVGIAEQKAVTMAAGMAVQGLKPVVAIYSTFLQRAYDQVIHDVCMQSLPVVFCLDRAGIVGEDGETHQGVFDLSYLRAVPNIVLMAPKDESDLRHMLLTALEHNGPIALRYPRGKGMGVSIKDRPVPIAIGKAVVEEEGRDAAIFAVGPLVYTGLLARERLLSKGISVAVVDCRFIKPLDAELLCQIAARVKLVVTLEENVLSGGFGSGIMEMLEQQGMQACNVKRIGLPDLFIPHGAPDLLRGDYGLTVERVVDTIEKGLQNPYSMQA